MSALISNLLNKNPINLSVSTYILLSFGFGILVWIMDAGVDYLFFYENYSYSEILITKIPPEEIYFRLLILALFIVFGIITSNFFIYKRKAESLIESFFKQPSSLFIILNREGKIFKINKGWQKLLGYGNSELYQYRFLDLIHVGDRTLVSDALDKVIESKQSEIIDCRCLRKDGSSAYFTWSLFSTTDDAYIYGIAIDAEEKKRVQETLQQKVEELERFNAAMVGRELKMISLKQEINELLESAGKQPKYEAPTKEK